MIIDGNKINREIAEELKKRAEGRKLSLAIVWVGDGPVSAKYIEKKKKFGEDIGVRVDVYKYGTGILTTELIAELKDILAKDPSGIIIQLPLPKNIDSTAVLDLLPIDKDVDLLSDWAYKFFTEGRSKIFPPVVASIKEIFDRNNIVSLQGLKAVVVGRGRLVGRPVASWLTRQGVEVFVISKEDWQSDLSTVALAQADIIVTGAGVPKLIKPDMVRDGVIIIDAATSDVAGYITGDVDPACVDKARIFSPVPGGVGPIAVAMLFKNLLILNKI